MQEVVTQYAVLAKRAGLDGVVCSAKEAAHIKESCGVDFLTICPGIRPKGSHVHDQKRVVTPTEAIKNGADFLVVGRTITQNSIPGKIFEEIVEEIENA
jgi:orotidine-5'-phosphate decarboxylase